MELEKKIWTKADGVQFQAFLKVNEKIEKQAFAKRIINTNFSILGISTPELKKIAKTISNGNFLSFLDLNLSAYYENYIINGLLITKIKDFSAMKTRLLAYAKKVDNWACCDLLKFKVDEKNKADYFNLSKEFINSKHTFVRRVGIVIWFELIKFDDCLKGILKLIPCLKDESEYYVNMVLAWFVAECFIKRRNEAIKLFESGVLNKFATNKAIQKCRDSFRVSCKDKEMLKKFKMV